MTFNLRNVLLGVIAVGSLALAGCSSGFSCTSTGSCAGDVALSGDALTACNNAVAGACGSQYKDVGTCEESNEVCSTDGGPATGSLTACSTQLTAFETCCTSNPTAAGCVITP